MQNLNQGLFARNIMAFDCLHDKLARAVFTR
jgi:hypothetical protein